MIVTPKPPSDPRDNLEIFRQLRARAGSYTPEVYFSDETSGAAQGRIFAYYVEAVLKRLNQAPDKNKLAFLDMLALQLTPARQARAPIAFELNPKAISGKAPAGTQVAAPPPPGSNAQIVFETEQEIGLTAGKLTEVVSLWPGRDSYIDHSKAYAAGLPIQLFALPQLVPIPHHLYLSHQKLLALAGSVTLSVEIQLQRPGSQALDIQWEYWDGKVWRGFLLDSLCQNATQLPDSTAGLTQSGRVELQTDGAKSEQTTVNGLNGYWIRARVTDPLPVGGAQILPEIDSLRLSSIIEQPFRTSVTVEAPRVPRTQQELLDRHQGYIVLQNGAGQPLTGATVKIHLDPNNLDAALPMTEVQPPSGLYQLAIDQFLLIKSVDILFFGVETGEAATIDDEHRPTFDNNILPVTYNITALAPDTALADSTKLDTTKPFYPFGQQPQPGSTFYFSNQETFSKPNAKMRVYLPLTSAPLGNINSNDPANGRKPLDRQIEWEYWNGREWAPLAPSSTNAGSLDFSRSEIADFTIPTDMAVTSVAGNAGLWVRARLVRGGFGYTQEVKWQAGTTIVAGVVTNVINTITYIVNQPPILADIRIAYTWQYGPFPLDRVISYNDFQYRDHTAEALSPGNEFAPYERTLDLTPELYLGFDKAPPAAQLGIFFDIVEQRGDVNGPALTWEYWNGFVWTKLPSTEGTGNLRLPGIAAVITEDDSAALARFDVPLHWLRVRLKEDGPPGSPTVTGIFPNAVWASQQRTLTDVVIGLSTGVANQSFAIHQIPVLDGERIEVRELSGPRANVEWRLVALDLFKGDETRVRDLEDQLGQEGPNLDMIAGDLRLRRNRLKQVAEVWVRWSSLLTLAGAGPTDRVYVIDRARGILTFGDGRSGRIPPEGASILGRVLRTGGGASGNVPAGAIKQMLGAVVGVQAAANPVAAEGGSDAETLSDFTVRGPQTVRHRGRAISISDYATLAHEASSAVAFARAIPVHDPGGRTLPGWVTVLILPNSLDPRPWPSAGLRNEVLTFLESRAPADIAAGHRIFVTGPDYLPIDVSATLAPKVASQAGDVEAAARVALGLFLHPLFGGPSGNGWDLGRSVYLSDLAAALERVDFLDFVSDLKLLVDGQVQGSSVAVGPLQIAVAGAIRITLQAP